MGVKENSIQKFRTGIFEGEDRSADRRGQMKMSTSKEKLKNGRRDVIKSIQNMFRSLLSQLEDKMR